ncbi:MAG: amino acid ABC transporter substrate-binding protein [Alphaproteobacteria bacterium]|nr:amino acid ABC transporter substrate-binding protein [Alphaproteobacteria bacterium]
MTRSFWIGDLAATILALAALPAAAAEPVRIAALLPMTGEISEYGEGTRNGVDLAVAEINAAGGVLDGRLLEIVTGDTRTSQQAGIAAAQRLVSVDRVVAVVGPMASGVTIPVATTVAAPAGMPLISPSATAPDLSKADDKDFLFRTTPHDAQQGVVLGDVAKEAGLASVAVVYVDNDYGKGLADAFAVRYQATGGRIVASIADAAKQASYRGELQRAARSTPDGLVLIAYPGDGIPIIRQSLDDGFFKRFVFRDGMKSTDMIRTIGAAPLEGMFGTAPQADVNAPSAVRFRRAYQAKFGGLPPRPFIDGSYDAVYLLALAIEAAGAAEGPKIRDALRRVAGAPGETVGPGDWARAKALIRAGTDIDYAGAAGSQDFDAAGDVPGSFGV